MTKLRILGGIFLLLLLVFVSRQFIFKPQTPKTFPSVSFLVFGDSGTGGEKQKELAGIMLDFPFSFILHTGDLAYPKGSAKELQNNFFNIYAEHLKRGKIYPAPGNHDYLTSNLNPYLQAFALPRQSLRSKDFERYYSYDVLNAHFIALDTNSPLSEASEKTSDDMVDWLEQHLKKAGSENWKIIFFHHPPYSSGRVHGSDLRVRKKLVPLFEKYQVDLVFTGHEHNYERTCKLNKDSCQTKGVTYVVTGGGGGPLYDFGERQSFTITKSSQYHFVYVTFSQCQLTGKTINLNKEIIDKFQLKKCNLKKV